MPRIKMINLLLVIFLVFALFPAGGAECEEQPGIMFILDASGSMWGQVEGRAKIDIAREVLRDLLEKMPQGLDLGLTAYGHRRTGDCKDVEKIVPIGPDSKNEILKHLAAIQPKGKTPIALSISQVAEDLKTREEETTVILISDGIETCEGDPCGVVKELKAAGIKFVMHVVGFDTGKEEFDELNCIATEGGGQFFEAKDKDALLGSLESASSQAITKVEPAVAATVTAVPSIGKLVIEIPEAGLKSLANIQILKGESPMKTIESLSPRSEHPLPPGSYTLVFGYANPNYKDPSSVTVATFDVEKGSETIIAFGVLLYNLAEGLDEAVDSVIIHDQAREADLVVNEYHGNGYYFFTPKPLPGGTYSVLLTHSRNPGRVTVARDMEIVSGKETVLTLDSGFAVKKPGSSEIVGWDLLPAGGSMPFLSIRRKSDNDEPLWRRFMVPPGNYDLNLIIKGMDQPLEIGQDISITPGSIVVFDTGM